MPRTNKDYPHKKNRLLEQIWSIFLHHGYQDTTLSLILRELGISKGVFYHYFDSKESCAQAAVDLYAAKLVEETLLLCEKQGFTDQDPFHQLRTLLQQGQHAFSAHAAAMAGINTPTNRLFHQMLMVALTKRLSVPYTAVIRTGAAQGLFHTAHPAETAEMLLVLSNFYLDRDLFSWNADTMPAKAEACKTLIASALGVAATTLFKEEAR